MTLNSNAETFSKDFNGAFNGAYGSIEGRLGVGTLHRLPSDFALPERDAFDDQRRQLGGVYDELLAYDESQAVSSGVRLFFLPPRHLVDYTDDHEREPNKQPRPLVETFLHDFCGTTVKGVVHLAGISDNWEVAVTLGDWGTRKRDQRGPSEPESRQRQKQKPEPIPELVALQKTIDDLPVSLRVKAVDMFPLAYSALGGILDRKDGMSTLLAHIPKQSNDPRLLQPRLLTIDELLRISETGQNLAAANSSEPSNPGGTLYGHYLRMGDRRHGGSFQEAEIIISASRPVEPAQMPKFPMVPMLRKEHPFELRRRPTFVSQTSV